MAVDFDHQLAVDDKAGCAQFRQKADDFREIPSPGLAGFRPQFDGLSCLEGKAAKPVPFGLELPRPAGHGIASADTASIGGVSSGSGKSD
jgi:hypothetical protein